MDRRRFRRRRVSQRRVSQCRTIKPDDEESAAGDNIHQSAQQLSQTEAHQPEAYDGKLVEETMQINRRRRVGQKWTTLDWWTFREEYSWKSLPGSATRSSGFQCPSSCERRPHLDCIQDGVIPKTSLNHAHQASVSTHDVGCNNDGDETLNALLVGLEEQGMV